jgi:tetratricopeptide (TPR) repeat protein
MATNSQEALLAQIRRLYEESLLGRISPSDAIHQLETYSQAALETRDDLLIARAFIHLGLVQMEFGFYEEAEESFHSGYPYSLRLSEKGMRGVIEINIGENNRRQYQNTIALQFFLRALETFEGLQEDPYVLVAETNIGLTLLESHDNRLAEKYFQKALELADRVHEDQRFALNICEVQLGLAEVARQRGAFDDAETHLLVAESLMPGEGYKTIQGHAALIRAQMAPHPECSPLYEQAAAILRKQGAHHLLLKTLLAWLRSLPGPSEEAKALAKEAWPMALRFKLSEEQAYLGQFLKTS